jgi:hypothetical protein
MLTLSRSAMAAEPAGPADLFPANTLAFAEIHDPATVGPQIASLAQGTVLADSIAFIQGRREKSKDPRDHFSKDQLAILGLLASPEMAAEFKRFRGLGIGLTGFTSQHEPEFAVALLTGDSAAAGLAARAFLTMTSVRKVTTVNEIPIYQFRQPVMNYDQNGRQIVETDKKMGDGSGEPTFAYLPGLFIAGTSKASLAEVITRYQGKGKDSLGTSAAFKEAAAAYRKPGLFVYANTQAICDKYDELRRKPNPAGAADMEPDALAWLKLVVNQKAVRSLAGTLEARDGGFGLTLGGRFDPAQKSPLFDLLSGPGAKVELLKHAPAPAAFAVALTFPEMNRSAAIIAFLDAVARADGELGRTPGEAIRELEAKLKLPIAGGLIGKTRAATIVMPVKQDLPKGALPLPVIALHTEGPQVAEAWEEFLPKLIGDLAGGPAPQTASETIDGMKIITIPAGNLPWKAAVHCTHKDGVLAIGLDRKLVAAAALGSATPAVTAPAESTVVGSFGLGGMVRLITERKPPEGPVVPRGPVGAATIAPQGFGRGGIELDDLGGFSEDPGNVPEDQKKSEAKMKADAFKAIDALPAGTIAVRHTGNEFRIDVFQPKLAAGGIAPIINAGVAWFDLQLNRTANYNNGPYGRFRRW